MKKKLISLALVLVMVLSLLPVAAFAAWEGEGNGSAATPWLIGKNTPSDVTAYVDGTTLHIKGTGAMRDFTYDKGEVDYPWADYVDKITTVVIGSGVTYIGDYALKDCSKLTSVKMPYVTSIGDCAFEDCNHLSSVEMPLVETIGMTAFKNCHCLTSVEMPSVTTIYQSAFNNCYNTTTGLTSVDIGSSIGSEPGLGATFSGCRNLTSVVIRAEEPPKMLSAFDDCPLTEIIVPNASVEGYKGSKWWSSKADIIKGAYYVNVAAAANGTVTASKKYVAATEYDSETITLTVTPAEGYQLKSLKYNDGEDHDITEAKSFAMPAANVTVTAEFEKAGDDSGWCILDLFGHFSFKNFGKWLKNFINFIVFTENVKDMRIFGGIAYFLWNGAQVFFK